MNYLIYNLGQHLNNRIIVEEVSGPMLKLWKVSRMNMGAYMCIARYGMP